MKKKSKNKTAAEFMADLAQDQNYQQMMEVREKKRIDLERQLYKDEQPLIRDLEAAGIKVTSVWDLVNTTKSYPSAIPILIKHLPKNYNYKSKEGIVRALSVPEAIGKAAGPLIQEYKRTPNEFTSYRWAIGNSVFTTITNSDAEEVMRIVKDTTNGESRHMFVLALGKLRCEKIDQVLIELLNDREMARYASEALGKLQK